MQRSGYINVTIVDKTVDVTVVTDHKFSKEEKKAVIINEILRVCLYAWRHFKGDKYLFLEMYNILSKHIHVCEKRYEAT